MNRKLVLMILFVFVSFFGFSIEGSAQDKKSQEPVGSARIIVNEKRPDDEATIKGIVPNYEIKKLNVEYLQTLQMPEIEFVFKTSQQLNLPIEAKKILSLHWKEAIKFMYDDKFNKLRGQASIERDMAWMKFCNTTQRKLEEISIEAPNGKRKISHTEASNLYAYINSTAAEVVKQVESIKSYAIILRSNDRTQFFQRASIARLQREMRKFARTQL